MASVSGVVAAPPGGSSRTRRLGDPDAAPARTLVAPLGLVLALSVAALLPVIPWLPRVEPYHAVFAVAHIALCSVGVAVAIVGGLRPCLLIASVFPYCWIALPSVYQISHHQAAWGDPGVTLDFSATLRAQGVIVVGQAALLLGYLIATRGRRHSTATVGWSVPRATWNRSLLVAGGLALASTVLLPLVVSAAGGIGALYQSRDAFNVGLSATGNSGTVTRGLLKIAPASMAASSAIIALWVWRAAPRGSSARRRALAVAVWAAGLLLIVANPFAFTRYIVLAAFGSLLMAWLRPTGRRAALACLGIALTAFLLAYPAADAFRRDAGNTRTGLSLLATRDFDGFQQTINSVHYVDAHGVYWGDHFISGALFFVPRAWWSGKAEPASLAVARDRGYGFTDLSLPFPAETYLDFGWPGVVILMTALGTLWGLLDQAWRRRSRLAILTAYLSVAQVGLWRGPFGSLAPVFGVAVISLLIALVVASTAPRHRATHSS